MTDARYPERWMTDRRFRKLTDEEFRSFVMALVWSVANRTDGHVDPEDLDLIPDFHPGIEVGLVEIGVWTKASRGWDMVDFRATQTSRRQLEGLDARRANDRERKERERERKRQAEAQSRDTGGQASRDMSRDDNRLGQARTRLGQAQQQADEQAQAHEHINQTTGEVLDQYDDQAWLSGSPREPCRLHGTNYMPEACHQCEQITAKGAA